ncbi:hypothetical protein TRFO_42687 [Tritrichomonas foetus]|uniref:RAVE complex protein Rav1 C-terminal domain-containing protein n=1 Tax=Tritrichomonas foetus TaxID=1144522 RepID=A0A1J4KZK9_9EUKA|nr:hypothetical protein TRFO_42687 [Tritrichomonas foetus]|eukprot:OHT15142.1 hypothetical protein TRFO_42687 [Tritrichomonas foetus]
MSSELKYSQVISIAPNRLKSFSATLPSLNNATYFAFGCESLIYIYDRVNFACTVVSAPDPTSPIVSLTFAGPKFLFCSNKNGLLYCYSRKSLQEPPLGVYKIGCIPISMTASDKDLFYIYQNSLYCLQISDFFTNKSPSILTDTESHNEIVVSSYGRAVAAYSLGGKFPEVWFSPFQKKKNFILPITANLIDIKWGLNESLILATATNDGLIRIWVESSDSLQLRQSGWFHFDHQISYICFCLPVDDLHQPQTNHPAQSTNASVFPSCKSPPFQILVGLKNSYLNNYGRVSLLKESTQPELYEVTTFDLNNEDDPFFAYADLRYCFNDNEIKMLITVTQLSTKSLNFYHVELGSKTVFVTIPYRVSFMESQVKEILTNDKNNVITKMADGKEINWSLNTSRFPPKDIFECKNGEIQVTQNKISFLEQGKEIDSLLLDFSPTFIKFSNQNSQKVMGLLASNEKITVLFFDNSFHNERHSNFQVFPIEIPNFIDFQNFSIKNVAFHSTDLLAISSNETIYLFYYQNNQYHYFNLLEQENQGIFFLPHLLFVIASKRSISFYSISSEGFEKQLSIDSTRITAINYFHKSLIIATKHALFRIFLPKNVFRLPLKSNHPFVFNTMLSLCQFSYLNDFFKNPESITFSSFASKVEAENFHFPSYLTNTELEFQFDSNSELKENEKHIENETKSSLNNGKNVKASDLTENSLVNLKYLKKFIKLLPINWANVDECGMKFLFCLYLSKCTPIIKNHIQFLSIWALLSSDQSNLTKLINFQTFTEICDSFLVFWVKSKNVLLNALNNYLSTHFPTVDEFDSFILFCVALGKRTLASKTALKHGNNKLAKFLSFNQNLENDSRNESNISAVKIERSAFAAQKNHRYSLASMFFLLRGMKKQAISVLNPEYKLKILLARVIDFDGWEFLIKDNFYRNYWTNNEKEAWQAIEKMTISDLKCNFLLLDAHRYQILSRSKFSNTSQKYLFDLKNIPYLVASLCLPQNQLTKPSIIKKPPEPNNEENTEENDDYKINENDFDELRPKIEEIKEFSFGGGWDNIEVDDFDEFEDDNNQNNDADLLIFEDKNINDKNTNQKSKSDGNNSGVFVSNLHEMFLSEFFESTYTEYTSISEEYIITLLAELYNRSHNSTTINYLLDIADVLVSLPQKLHIITAIMFSVTYSLSEFKWMTPMIQENFDPLFIITALEHFRNKDYESEFSKSNRINGIPDLISNLSNEIQVTTDDKLLASFIAFDQMLHVMNDLLITKDPTLFTSFLHHRHRLMYSKLIKCHFSNPAIANDLNMLGIKCEGVINRMNSTRKNEKWMISLNDDFASPFFTDNKFKFTTSYNIRAPSSKIIDLCIDYLNNNRIAIAANEVFETLITQQPLDGTTEIDEWGVAEAEDGDEWDVIIKHSTNDSFSSSAAGQNTRKSPSLNSISNKNGIQEIPSINEPSTFEFMKDEFKSPLLSFLRPQNICSKKEIKPGFDKYNDNVNSRNFSLKWPKINRNSKDICAKCISASPKKEIFVTGDNSGNVHVWDFNSTSNKRMKSTHELKFTNKRIVNIEFNEYGDRLALADSQGNLFMTDFYGETTKFNIKQNSFYNSSFYTYKNYNSYDNLSHINSITTHNNRNLNNNLNFGINTNFEVKNPINDVSDIHPTISWLNNDTQILVCYPSNPTLFVYDSLAGCSPVATFDLNKEPQDIIPLAFSNMFAATGFEDGSSVIFDVRIGLRIARLALHEQPITVVKYDPSGSFFITGGMDNKVTIVEAKTFNGLRPLNNVLPNYNPTSQKRGIYSIGISKQAIVASGFSPYIHVWTKIGPI